MDIGSALRFDPLAEAERVSGKSYKDDDETMRFGFGMALLHNENKEALLRQARDSYFNMPFAESLALFAEMGFTEILRESFAGNSATETYVILWHPDGILASCESYNGTDRNSAKVYYNYRHHDGGYPSGLTSSGGMTGEVWVGDHDAREGVRFNLDAMRAKGAFLSQWSKRPFLWLLNYTETRQTDYDYRAINAARIAQLPEHVRAAITPGA